MVFILIENMFWVFGNTEKYYFLRISLMQTSLSNTVNMKVAGEVAS